MGESMVIQICPWSFS